VRGCHQKIASPAVFGQITTTFKTALHRWAERHHIPWVEFRKGERKDTVAQRYRDRFTKPSGVVLIGVAQERASTWSATKQRRGPFVDFMYLRKSVCVNHYYIYVIDPEWGPAFVKVCGYAPYAIKICLNGHEWAKRQLARRRIRFVAPDNGFLSCGTADALQTICDSLSATDLDAFFARWQAQLPLPLTAAHGACGFTYQLSILQMEVSLTQVFDRPLRGREPRVTAVLNALCHFLWTTDGLTNAQLRPLVARCSPRRTARVRWAMTSAVCAARGSSRVSTGRNATSSRPTGGEWRSF
jgi:hypothetical protein